MSTSRGSSSLVGAAAALAVVVGVVMRFVAPSPLWLDEALSVHIATGEVPLTDALRRDGHPGLYYLLLGWWIDAFGDGDTTVRALSGLFGLATLPVVWMAARRHGRAVSVAVLVLAASSPYLIRYATEARMYALLVLVIAVGWWALEATWARPTPVALSGVAAATAAAVNTHYWSFYAIGAAGLIIVAAAWPERAWRRTVPPLGAMALGVVSFVPWLPVFLDQLRDTGTPWADRARPTEVLIETLQGIGGNNRFEGETLGILLALLVVLGVVAVGPAREGVLEMRASVAPSMRIPVAATVLGLGLGAAAAIVTAGAFEARYAAIALPFVLLLAGRGAAVLGGRGRIVVLAGVVLLGFAISVDEARRTRSQGEDVAAAIDASAAPGDVVVFCPDQVGPATTRYLEAEIDTRAFPSGDGVTVDWRDYLDRAAGTDPVTFADDASRAAGAGRVWFVSGIGYRGLDGPCATVQTHLTTLRPGAQVVGLTDLFEGMFAIRFDAP